jgi:hypothetical protein
MEIKMGLTMKKIRIHRLPLFFLIIMILIVACSVQPRSKQRIFRITVLDKTNNLPVDSAQVVFTSIVESRDVNIEVKYTNAAGKCSFPVNPDPRAQYQFGASKTGFLSYFDEADIDLVKSHAFVYEKTGENIILYVTSDSLNHVNYWEKNAIRYDIDTLVSVLKSDKYPHRSSLPVLGWKDIPGLLAIGNDSTLITNFPVSVLSSFSPGKCYLGIVALWFIESARITELKKISDPAEKFPSMTPAMRYRGNPDLPPNSHEMLGKAFKAYKDWWEKNKNLKPEQGSKSNPLEKINLEWR